jgi:hypothetical protein
MFFITAVAFVLQHLMFLAISESVHIAGMIDGLQHELANCVQI